MDALGASKASLVGNSFGGAVALRVAALHPERVASLALFSAPDVPEPEPSAQLLSTWGAVEEAEAAGDTEQAIRETVAGWVRPGADPTVGERIAAMQRLNQRERSSRSVTFADDPLEADPGRIAAIDCPVLVTAGEEDLPDFKAAVDGLTGRLPAATGTLIPGCRHLAPLEAPAESLRLILATLDR
jgi:pimeloyl-ACP methyl ester carboxylesterase